MAAELEVSASAPATADAGPSSSGADGDNGVNGDTGDIGDNGDNGDGDGGDDTHHSLEEALEFKSRGNTHFAAKEYEQANLCYTHAIDLAPPAAPERAVFFANRAACHSKAGEHTTDTPACKRLDALLQT